MPIVIEPFDTSIGLTVLFRDPDAYAVAIHSANSACRPALGVRLRPGADTRARSTADPTGRACPPTWSCS